jgi:hypothetical protein
VLSYYARKADGSAITETDITANVLIENVATAIASITAVGGGWYRVVSAPRTATGSTSNAGWYVGENTTVYVDGIQLEQLAYPTPYADGSLGTGHAWTGTADASTSTRTAASVRYANPLSATAGTVALWYKPAAGKVIAAERYLFAEGNIAGYIHSDGTLNITDGSNILGVALPSLDPQTWVHLAFTWDATGMRLYRNGALMSAFVGTYTAPALGANLYIGSDAAGTPANQCDGWIDELFTSTAALPAASIAALAAAVAAGGDAVFALDETITGADGATGVLKEISVTIPVSSITGTFLRGHTITGGTSAATGIITTVNASWLRVRVTAGTFKAGEGITQDDGAVATTGGTTDRYLYVEQVVGVFAAGGLTGGTSGATATATSAIVEDCGKRAMQQSKNAIASKSNTGIAIITGMSINSVSTDLCTRIYPHGGGAGDERPSLASLAPATISHGAVTGSFTVGETVTGGTSGATSTVTVVASGVLTVDVMTGTYTDGETITTTGGSATVSSSDGTFPPAGYTISRADGYLEHIAAAALYGRIERSDIAWPEILPRSRTVTQREYAAEQVLQKGVEWLRKHIAAQFWYAAQLQQLAAIIYPGQTMYTRCRDLGQNIDVAERLRITGTTLDISQAGTFVAGVNLATVDMQPPNDDDNLIAALDRERAARARPAGPQGATGEIRNAESIRVSDGMVQSGTPDPNTYAAPGVYIVTTGTPDSVITIGPGGRITEITVP